jgi:hypothetical protein
VRPTETCACAIAPASTPSKTQPHRIRANVFMSATFPGDDLPDAGFLVAIDTRSRHAGPLDKFA